MIFSIRSFNIFLFLNSGKYPNDIFIVYLIVAFKISLSYYESVKKYKITIDEKTCIGCGVCEINAEEVFEIKDNVSKVKKNFKVVDKAQLKQVTDMCPTGSIRFEIIEDK